MATRGKKKPAKRKPKGATRTNAWLAAFGWSASAVVASAWAVTDGRPARYAADLIADLGAADPEPRPAADDIAALIRNARTVPARARDVHASSPVRAPVPQERTGSIRPLPKAAAAPREMAAQVAPIPVPSPSLPLEMPPVEFAIRQARPLALPSSSIAAGEQRHATRALTAHAAPDGASPTVAAVESGSAVAVLRTAGDWRYVRDDRTGSEGWVDGRFLAGEALSTDLAELARQEPTRGR